MSDILIGIDGAGSAHLDDNVAINDFGKRHGAEMYNGRAVTGAQLRDIERDIVRKIRNNALTKIYLFGYSVGGDQVLELASGLKDQGLTVSGLVCFDPHSPLNPLPVQSDYNGTDISLNTLNFHQRSPYELGSNPFYGGIVKSASNIDLTSQGVVHTTIVRTALKQYESIILRTLGLANSSMETMSD